MGVPGTPQPVMLFVGMLSGEVALLEELDRGLQENFGPVLYRSDDLPWNYTAYYRKELGDRIFRRFLFFRDLIPPDRIAGIKLDTNKMEQRYLREEKGELFRRINLDPGYLDLPKVVLVSTKDYSHRLYLSSGIYGELTLTNVGGGFQPLPYTYPDYRAAETVRIFNTLRGELTSLRRKKKTST